MGYVREWNKAFGEVAAKKGRLAQDIIYYNIIEVLQRHYDFKGYDLSLYSEKWGKDGKEFDIDIRVVIKDIVFMVEVISTPELEYVDQILEKAIQFGDFYPEHNDKQVIPIYASLMFDDEIIDYATKKGLYLVAYKEWEYMDIINFDKVKRNS
jgi:hypothetical protein